jgi:hypothetical protein
MNETIKAQYVLGTIHILRQHNFGLFHLPTNWHSIDTVWNVCKTGHFLKVNQFQNDFFDVLNFSKNQRKNLMNFCPRI